MADQHHQLRRAVSAWKSTFPGGKPPRWTKDNQTARYNALILLLEFAKEAGYMGAHFEVSKLAGDPYNIAIAAFFDCPVNNLTRDQKKVWAYLTVEITDAVYTVFADEFSKTPIPPPKSQELPDIEISNEPEPVKEEPPAPATSTYKSPLKPAEPEPEPEKAPPAKEFSSAAEANAALAKIEGLDFKEPVYDKDWAVVLKLQRDDE